MNNVIVTYLFLGVLAVMFVFGAVLILRGLSTLLNLAFRPKAKKDKKDSAKPYERAA